MNFKQKFVTSTAMALTLISGYGRRSYAACVSTGAPNYLCSGTNTSSQNISNVHNAHVTTAPGFSVNTSVGNAITLTGDGALSFVDTNNSSLQTTAGYGLYIYTTSNNGATPGSILIDANGTISAQSSGIYTLNYGNGSLSIATGGDVTSTNGRGISARNLGMDLTIETANGSMVSGGQNGIVARNYGGILSISAGGDVMGVNDYGIYTLNYGTDLTIETVSGSTVSGRSRAIDASNLGTGSLSITAGGDVTSTNADGVFARNNGTDLSIETLSGGTVSGGSRGIYARNNGSGTLSIAVGGDVTGVNAEGIVARNYYGTDMLIETSVGSTVSGANRGISARNYSGTGNLSITAEGDVTGTNDTGIYALNNGTDLSIEILSGSTVSGGIRGIYARNYGTGSLSITAGGDVTGTNRYGILARNAATGTDLTIETASGSTVSGGNSGIDARNLGTGSLSITARGDVIGSNNQGIYAYSYGGTDLTIETASGSTVSGGKSGIYVRNNGTGSLSITAGGDVTGTNRYGIFARNAATGTDLTIETTSGSTVSGRERGILASNHGAGSLSITAGGDVMSMNRTGIYAHNFGTDLSIETSSSSTVSAGEKGIDARNFGTGSLSIAAEGDILSYRDGIYAQNNGSGHLSITSEGEIVSSGNGIYARNNYGADLTITTGTNSSITSLNDSGLNTVNFGTGSLSITHHGRISGNTGFLIRNQGGTSTGIFTDGVIEGTAGIAINFLSGSQTTATPIEIAGGRIIGDIIDNYRQLGFSPVTVTGDFVSEGNFLVSDFNVATGGDFTLSEDNSINSDNIVDVDGIFNSNGGTVQGVLAVNAGGRFSANEQTKIVGDLINNGTTSIATGKNLIVNGVFSGSGELRFGFNTVNDHALLTVNGGSADLTDQHIVVDVTGVTGLSTGQQALIVTGAAPIIGGPGGTAVAVDDTSVLWDFRMVDGTGVGAPTSANDLFLIAGQAAPINNLTSTTNNERTADVLMTLQSTTDPELALIVGNMNGASTSAAFNEVLEAAQPVADASERIMQTDFLRRTQDMIGARLNELRSLTMREAEARFGMKEDETSLPAASGLQVWGYGFGTPPEQGDHGLNDLAGRQWLAGSAGYTHQSRRQGIDGFDAVSGGAAFGIDTGNTYVDRVFGLAVGYGHAEVDSNNANRAENEIDSLQLLAYASKTFSNNYYGDLKASYAQASNDTTRYDVGGVPGLTANGDFTSKQAGLQANVGKRILHKDYLITPEFGVNWLHYTADGYTETGAGGANLTVDTKSADSVEIGGSVRIVKEIKRDSGAIILPELRAGYYYDVIGDPIQKTVSFAGGGSSFLIESPNPSQHRINLGAGVTVKGTGDWDYSLNYSLDMQSQAQNHNLVAKASWKF